MSCVQRCVCQPLLNENTENRHASNCVTHSSEKLQARVARPPCAGLILGGETGPSGGSARALHTDHADQYSRPSFPTRWLRELGKVTELLETFDSLSPKWKQLTMIVRVRWDNTCTVLLQPGEMGPVGGIHKERRKCPGCVGAGRGVSAGQGV